MDHSNKNCNIFVLKKAMYICGRISENTRVKIGVSHEHDSSFNMAHFHSHYNITEDHFE